MMVTITVPRPPSVNSLFRNAPGKGRVKTSLYKSWIHEAGWMVQAQRPRKITGTYHIKIELKRWTQGRCDVANYEKALSDLLVRQGVVEDDSKAESVTMAWTGTDPAVAVITITPMGAPCSSRNG